MLICCSHLKNSVLSLLDRASNKLNTEFFNCEQHINTKHLLDRASKIRIKFNDGISEPIHINKGVRQGCGLSPVLFNIYINKIIQGFKTVIRKGIQLNNRKLVNMMLYADDQILMATSDDLQTMAQHLNVNSKNT